MKNTRLASLCLLSFSLLACDDSSGGSSYSGAGGQGGSGQAGSGQAGSGQAGTGGTGQAGSGDQPSAGTGGKASGGAGGKADAGAGGEAAGTGGKADAGSGGKADAGSGGKPDAGAGGESAGTGGQGGPPGDCCTETPGTAGCTDTKIKDCVCADDDFCCTDEWDSFCVEKVASLGCGLCAGQCKVDGDCKDAAKPICDGNACVAKCTTKDDCGSFACDTGTGKCVECTASADCTGDSPVCDLAKKVCVGCAASADCKDAAKPICDTKTGVCGVCAADTDCKDAAAPTCSAGKCVKLGNCCEATTGVAGCSDSKIKDCVCAQDPFCCDTEWDSQCIELIKDHSCGTCPLSMRAPSLLVLLGPALLSAGSCATFDGIEWVEPSAGGKGGKGGSGGKGGEGGTDGAGKGGGGGSGGALKQDGSTCEQAIDLTGKTLHSTVLTGVGKSKGTCGGDALAGSTCGNTPEQWFKYTAAGPMYLGVALGLESKATFKELCSTASEQRLFLYAKGSCEAPDELLCGSMFTTFSGGNYAPLLIKNAKGGTVYFAVDGRLNDQNVVSLNLSTEPLCSKDADCKLLGRSLCDVSKGLCFECLSNADCKGTSAPLCLPQSGQCVECTSDADCKAADKPVCGQNYRCAQPGNCCAATPNVPGCTVAGLKDCVCPKDPFCCDTGWDELCVDEVAQYGCGLCPGQCKDDGDCKDAAAPTCSANKCVKLGNCCEATTGVAGCSDSKIKDCVCAEEPACCSFEWGASCVDLVKAKTCGACK